MKKHAFQHANMSARRKNAVPRLPHENDESTDNQASGPCRKIQRGYQGLMEGQVDADLRNERGVDAVVNKTPTPSPVNPIDEPRQKNKH